MAMDIGNTTKFIATDEVVLKSATHTQGVEFTAVEIDVRTKKTGTIFFYAKGVTSASGNLVFTLQHSSDATNWFDLPAKTITMSGTTQIIDITASFLVNLNGYGYLRLSTIQNTDATYSGNANAALFIKE